MLAKKMEATGAECYLVNTGWVGGKFGVGKRCPLKATRAIIDAIHDGSLGGAEYETFPVFNLQIPKAVNGVDAQLLDPAKAWSDKSALKDQVANLAKMFQENFKKYAADCAPEVLAAGPQV